MPFPALLHRVRDFKYLEKVKKKKFSIWHYRAWQEHKAISLWLEAYLLSGKLSHF